MVKNITCHSNYIYIYIYIYMCVYICICVCVCVCSFSDSSDIILMVFAAETCDELLSCTNIHFVVVFESKN